MLDHKMPKVADKPHHITIKLGLLMAGIGLLAAGISAANAYVAYLNYRRNLPPTQARATVPKPEAEVEDPKTASRKPRADSPSDRRSAALIGEPFSPTIGRPLVPGAYEKQLGPISRGSARSEPTNQPPPMTARHQMSSFWGFAILVAGKEHKVKISTTGVTGAAEGAILDYFQQGRFHAVKTTDDEFHPTHMVDFSVRFTDAPGGNKCPQLKVAAVSYHLDTIGALSPEVSETRSSFSQADVCIGNDTNSAEWAAVTSAMPEMTASLLQWIKEF